MDILTFISVLAVSITAAWLIHTHLKTAKAHAEELKNEALTVVEQRMMNFENALKKDYAAIVNRAEAHEEAIKKLNKDLLSIGAVRMTGIADRFAHLNKQK
jgi:hypothetical protein